MAGIRGVIDPFPKRGDKATGIFSTRGAQKNDGVTAERASVATKNAAHAASGRVAPSKRDNHCSGKSKGPSSQSKNGGK